MDSLAELFEMWRDQKAEDCRRTGGGWDVKLDHDHSCHWVPVLTDRGVPYSEDAYPVIRAALAQSQPDCADRILRVIEG